MRSLDNTMEEGKKPFNPCRNFGVLSSGEECCWGKRAEGITKFRRTEEEAIENSLILRYEKTMCLCEDGGRPDCFYKKF